MTTTHIGHKLKSLREQYNLSQQQVADAIGIARASYSQIELWSRKVTAQEKKKFADLFEIDQSEFDHDMITIAPELDATDSLYKFKNLVLYLLAKCGGKPNVWEVVLNKLLYFCDFNHYELTFEPITEAIYCKLPRGPAPAQMEQILDEMTNSGLIQKINDTYYWYPQKRYIANIQPNLSLFTGQQIAVIEDVINSYGDKNAKRLTDFSHEDMPYKATKNIGDEISYGLAGYREWVYSVAEWSDD